MHGASTRIPAARLPALSAAGVRVRVTRSGERTPVWLLMLHMWCVELPSNAHTCGMQAGSAAQHRSLSANEDLVDVHATLQASKQPSVLADPRCRMSRSTHPTGRITHTHPSG
jgi:hypothetical protein